jgi:tetratricopeptide (TPR) repeat protein
MSKLVLFYFVLSTALWANDASYYMKKANLRDFAPQKMASASKKFYRGMDDFTNSKFSSAHDAFISASKEKGISREEQGIAIYNAALSLERTSKYDKALRLYREITKDEVYAPLFKGSYYRIGACCHKQKNWTCVIESLNNWKNSQSELSLVEEFEFRVRKGTAYFELGAYRDVVDHLESAVKTFKNQRRERLRCSAYGRWKILRWRT